MFQYKITTTQFKKKVVEIFGRNLIFAFICGGFARKKVCQKNDLDMFVCVRKLSVEKKLDFHRWYLLTHLQYGFKPDAYFGEEIMTYGKLLREINKVKNCRPVLIIYNRNIYDGIVWAGMLSGKQVGFVGNRRIFKKIKGESLKICKYWVKNISTFSKSQNLDLVLKKIIKYNPPK